jgi:hypothetical protein
MKGNDIIINAGQSNSSGAGLGDFEDSDTSLDGRIFQIGRDLTLKPATRLLEYWKWAPAGTSYDLTLARLYAGKFLTKGRNLIVVPAAVGGSSILDWLGKVAGRPYYENMKKRTEVALAQPGKNKIVLWVEHQGEADVGIIDNPNDPRHPLMASGEDFYREKLALIDRVRADFGTFPMVFGLFSRGTSKRAGGQQVLEAIQRVCKDRPLCGTTKAIDLQLNADLGIKNRAGHFSSAAQETLAHRHFAEFQRLIK